MWRRCEFAQGGVASPRQPGGHRRLGDRGHELHRRLSVHHRRTFKADRLIHALRIGQRFLLQAPILRELHARGVLWIWAPQTLAHLVFDYVVDKLLIVGVLGHQVHLRHEAIDRLELLCQLHTPLVNDDAQVNVLVVVKPVIEEFKPAARLGVLREQQSQFNFINMTPSTGSRWYLVG